MGFGQPVSRAAFRQAVDWLRVHGAPNWALQVPSDALSNPIRAHLLEAGLSARGHGWAKHVRNAMRGAASLHTDLKVRLLGADAADDFARVAQDGFGIPAAFRGWFAALVGRPRWRIFAAYDDTAPIAVGAMFVDQGLGWLGFDTTLPSHRKRGVQRALIDARLADGCALSLRGFVAETARPSVGLGELPFTSFRNYGRSGFEIAYALYNYVPEARRRLIARAGLDFTSFNHQAGRAHFRLLLKQLADSNALAP